MNVTNNFRWFSKSLTEPVNEDYATDDGRLLLEGIASTTSRDLNGDVISKEAIGQMKESAIGLNIYADHLYGLSDTVGVVKEVNETDENTLSIKFLVTKQASPILKDLLDTGVQLGLSIGGSADDYDNKTNTVNSIRLREISLTTIPANTDTMGTVAIVKDGEVLCGCLSGACKTIIKNMEKNNMVDEQTNPNSSDSLNDEQISQVDDRINQAFQSLADQLVQGIVDGLTPYLEQLESEKSPSDEASESDDEQTTDDDEKVEKADDESKDEDDTYDDESKDEIAKTFDYSKLADEIIKKQKALEEEYESKEKEIAKSVTDQVFNRLGRNNSTIPTSKVAKAMDEVPVEKDSLGTVNDNGVLEFSVEDIAKVNQMRIQKKEERNPFMKAFNRSQII